MFLQIFLLHFIFLLFQPASSTLTISKPGCPSQCGNVSIPYPYGVGSNCSLDSSFEIKCDTSTVPPKAYLSIADKEREVIEINETYIRVKYLNLVSVCYDNLSEHRHGNATSLAPETHTLVNLMGTQFTLSNDNQLFALGCDVMALGVTEYDRSFVTGGCSAFCEDEDHAQGGGDGYCRNSYMGPINSGCCQASIYRGEGQVFAGVQFINLGGILPRRKHFSCSHATIREVSNMNETAFSYPLYYLNNSTALLNDNRISVVRLDWMVDSSPYACQDSVSYNIENAYGGYLCSCLEGYEGNPYLPGGCIR